MNTSDFVIIGGGLTGLLLTHRLVNAGKSVQLVEARDQLGGRYLRPDGRLGSPELEFHPATPMNVTAIEWLKSVRPQSVHWRLEEHQTEVFTDGEWRPLSGFGDANFESRDELSQLFLHTQVLALDPGLEHIVRDLIEQLPISPMTKSEVTALNVRDGAVREIVINGDKVIPTQQVIFCGHPKELNQLISGDALPGKHRTRLAKMGGWTAVTLELQHSQPLATDNRLKVFLTSSKDFEPVVGQVNGSTSKWLTLVPSSREGEHEFVGQCLKYIRRQLKRAWPDLGESAGGSPSERIFVQANAFGQNSLKTKETFRFPEIQNLHLAHHTLAATPGEWAAVATAMGIEAELGGLAPQSSEEQNQSF